MYYNKISKLSKKDLAHSVNFQQLLIIDEWLFKAESKQNPQLNEKQYEYVIVSYVNIMTKVYLAHRQ